MISLIIFSYYLRKQEEQLNVLRNSKPTLLFQTFPGEQAQVYWKENFCLYNRKGEKFVFNIFLYKLSFSRKSKLFLTFDKKQDTVIRCLINSFIEYNCVAKEIVFDNTKTVVYTPNSSKRENYLINPKFLEFSKDCGFNIYACKAYNSQTKGKVESLAKVVDELIVYDGEFDNLSDLSKIISELEDRYNNKINKSISLTPNNLFISHELKVLKKIHQTH